MENMSKEEFMRQSDAAIRRMREMNRRVDSYTKRPPEKIPEKRQESSPSLHNNKPSFSLPILDMLKKDSDITIIIGILLLLLGEKGDKRLLFALLYILM